MREPRAVLFDLDDTLYAQERFILSGFRAVAAHVAAASPLSADDALEVLLDAFQDARGQELQALAVRAGLAPAAVPGLVDLMRTHVPDLRLPELTRAVLCALAPGWRLGIVTNGRPDIQARKVRALGLGALVSTVVYATEHGSGRGKPDRAPFLEACRRLGVAREAAVFVGDDPICDIAGARDAGLRAIWLPARAVPPGDRTADVADIVVASLAAVPGAAARVLSPEWRAHAA
ncbi:MAG: HAD family hydrolase [Vicinamibacterales bacterium]